MSAESKKEELYLGKYRLDDEGKYYDARLFARTGRLSYPIDLAEGSLVFKLGQESPSVDPSTVSFREGKPVKRTSKKDNPG